MNGRQMTNTTDWKMTTYDKLIDSYAKYYSPAEHLATDKIIVLFKGTVICKQCIQKRHRGLG